eukprot:CAMPEP_0174587572 /NCGR_PEP_ID=MMETSP0929-20130131/32066_1 /TAXON_ID=548131 ORGANISM="Ostreococcus mediterraneus, Strain clade-D-RCC2572" /NCGR_SAMPLE_ID=MMETSP0929 /ASSEMBLY_ACC=CAM_ASM_000573 /LENGTH=57 /DNA_ID=CAMNT_0015769629 /DNA_START=1 /DNA_END=174 /DNA_ORIENTATION=+
MSSARFRAVSSAHLYTADAHVALGGGYFTRKILPNDNSATVRRIRAQPKHPALRVNL